MSNIFLTQKNTTLHFNIFALNNFKYVMRKSLALSFISLFILISSNLAWAQMGTGSISGQVRDEYGNGIENVTVRATVFDVLEGVHQRKWDVTDSDGNYKIEGLDPENYVVRTINNQNYVDEYYNNKMSRQEADKIKVNDGSEVTGIDFELGHGGFISGKVTDQANDPLAKIEIHFIDAKFKDVVGIVKTDTSGKYTSPGLRPNQYFVRAYGVHKGYIPVYWRNEVKNIRAADSIEVTQDVTNRHNNFKLRKGGTITGHVYSENSNMGIDSVWVVVLDSNGVWVSDSWTDQDGMYSAGGLPDGSYKLHTYEVDSWKYRPEFHVDADNFEQAQWVSVTSPTTTGNIDFYLSEVTNKLIENEYIGIAVTDKFPGTNLTIGTTGGLESPADDSLSLLNGHPRPVMSFTTIRINSQNYRFGSKDGNSPTPPTIMNDGKSIYRTWEIENIEITQIASIVSRMGDQIENTGMLEYVIVNQDATDHEVGLRMLFDTKLGESDGATIDLPYDKEPSDLEREFVGENVPLWWTAKKIENGKTLFSAQGTLQGERVSKPDRFVIAQYQSIESTNWQYNPTNRRYTSDSAVALWWFPKIIAAGDTLRIITYYGLGADTPDTTAPQIEPIFPVENQKDFHPDSSISFMVSDIESGVDLNQMQIQIDNFPATYQTDGSGFKYIVTCTPAEPITFNQEITVNITGIWDFAPIPNGPAIKSYKFATLQDAAAPYVIKISPESGATDTPIQTMIEIEVADITAGIDTSTIMMKVGGDTVKPAIKGSLQNLKLTYAPPDLFPYATRINIALELRDRSNPPNPMVPFESHFTTMISIVKDTLKPRALNMKPVHEARDVIPQPIIEVELIDDYSGVNKDSIKLTINSEKVIPNITGNKLDYWVRYTPPKPFNFGKLVKVKIFAQDLALAEQMMEGWNFTIIDDKSAPYITDGYPAPNATQVPPNSTIQFYIRDDLAGVDSNSIKIYIDNTETSFNCERDSTNAYKISYSLSPNWNQEDSIQLRVLAQDLIKPEPNKLDSTWQFTTSAMLDTFPPYVTGQIPAPGAIKVSALTSVLLNIKDKDSGVDHTSIQLKINDRPVNPEISDDLWSRKVEFSPKTPFEYGEHVEVTVDATDQASNKMPTEKYSFTIIVDSEPPEVTDLYPRNGETNVSPQVQPSFFLRDNLSGVDPTTIEVWIDSIPAILTGKQSDSTNCRVWYKSTSPFNNGDSVEVTIKASDRAGNAMPIKKYHFYISDELPDIFIESFRTDPPKDLTINVPFELVARISYKNVKITSPFHVSFYQFTNQLGDVLLSEFDTDTSFISTVPNSGQISVQGFPEEKIIEIRQTCSYPKGQFQFKVIVDSKDQITESQEMNNFAEILVTMSEGAAQVGPNPFTPNSDGFNDRVKFDFTQLDLLEPQLKLFTFQGHKLITLQHENDATFFWDGTNSQGKSMSPGIYLYVLEDKNKVIVKGSVVLAR